MTKLNPYLVCVALLSCPADPSPAHAWFPCCQETRNVPSSLANSALSRPFSAVIGQYYHCAVNSRFPLAAFHVVVTLLLTFQRAELDVKKSNLTACKQRLNLTFGRPLL